ncbi:MAG: tol-pal system-associated acyl-CoA thioesterase [Acetobacteraceae bacterium]
MSGPPAGCHVFALRVYYEDTDAGGIVYHASYLRFAERARTEALRALGVPHAELADLCGLIFVVRRIKVDYLRPARLDDALAVTTRVASLAGAAVRLVQEIRNTGGDATLVRLEVDLAVVRRSDGRPARLPPRWREALARLAGADGKGD